MKKLSSTLAYSNRQISCIQERWNIRAEDWDKYIIDPDCHVHLDDGYIRFLQFAEERLEFQFGSTKPTILDLGCGTGLVGERLSIRAKIIIYTDISPVMISKAKQKVIPNSAFIIADAFSLPFPNSSFDMLVSRGVMLSHYGLPHLHDLLREIARVIRPGGIAILDYLHTGGMVFYPYKTEGKTYFGKGEIEYDASCVQLSFGHLDGGIQSRIHIIELLREE